MVYGDADLIDDSGETVGQFGSKQTSYRQMLRGSVHIPQATTFFRTDVWKRVGPLDLSLFFSFDYDLWVRIAKVSQVSGWSRIRCSLFECQEFSQPQTEFPGQPGIHKLSCNHPEPQPGEPASPFAFKHTQHVRVTAVIVDDGLACAMDPEFCPALRNVQHL